LPVSNTENEAIVSAAAAEQVGAGAAIQHLIAHAALDGIVTGIAAGAGAVIAEAHDNRVVAIAPVRFTGCIDGIIAIPAVGNRTHVGVNDVVAGASVGPLQIVEACAAIEDVVALAAVEQGRVIAA